MYSYLDWEGLKSTKFKDKGRKRFQQLAPEILSPRINQTKLNYNTKESEYNEKPIIRKINPNVIQSTQLQRYYSETTPRDQFIPNNRKIDYERKHLRQEKDNHFEDLLQGIKTYQNSYQETQQQYILEDAMQRKVRVNEYRNGIGLHYLGDKAYHIPEYSPNFYKMPDGVIPGSNIQNRHQFLNKRD